MVTVLSHEKKPLMPCTQRRARKLMECGRAKPYWFKGFFCIILQTKTLEFKQDICIGIDPGSKMCGLTVKSEAHTILNIQYVAKTKIKDKVETCRNARRNRRQRNTPYKKCRFNRSIKSRIPPPSTKARWQQHLNMIKFCNKMYPISHVAFEDIKAKTIKGARHWNVNFSPLQHGKQWGYTEIEKDFKLTKYNGSETYNIRQNLGLEKSKDKMDVNFDSHCVDSWAIVNDLIGGHIVPENKRLSYIKPLNFYRRQLHKHCPAKGGVRVNYGSTRSLGLKRGTLVVHPKHGKCLVSGTSKGRISLRHLESNKRLCENARKEDLKILTNFAWNLKVIND